jgi:hypothetical protein
MLKHVVTKESYKPPGEAIVKMRLADNPNESEAKESLELTVPLARLALDQRDVKPGMYQTAIIQIAALRYVRDAAISEIERLSNPQGR